MLYYLLNATAIWLICLIAFDAFLHRESYHSYNRFYLLGTFALGLLMPLYEWRGDSIVYSTGISRPVVEGAATVKSSIVSTTDNPVAMDWQQWLILLYIAGVAVSLFFLIKEIATLIRMYRMGDKSKDGVWSIIETGKAHSPFSAFRMVFISSKNDYSEEQLKMILHHEEQHGHAMHFIDLMFMQLAKVVFWFHPLVYVYYNRLLTVHEYQADAAVDEDPKTYGQFLIEQTMLGTAPALSHSFNRSPIKKRILMLTRNSSALSKSKMLLALPITFVCVLCFSKNAFSDDKRVKKGNQITYHGNVIEVKEWIDTVIIINPATNKEETLISQREPVPILLNGKKIYTTNEFTLMKNSMGSKYNGNSGFTYAALKEYLLSNMKDELKKLDDGEYFMNVSNIIIDESGDIVYHEFKGMSRKEDDKMLNEDIQKEFAKKVDELLTEAPSHPPAYADGIPVASIINDMQARTLFIVKNGKLTHLQ